MTARRRTVALLRLRLVAAAGTDADRLRRIVSERVEPRLADEVEACAALRAAPLDGGVLALFAGVPEAASCALGLRDFFRDENWKDHGLTSPLRARIALHSGLADLTATTPTGGAVERVARLCEATSTGEVWATPQIVSALESAGDHRFAFEAVESSAFEEREVTRVTWMHERRAVRRQPVAETDLVRVALQAPVLDDSSLLEVGRQGAAGLAEPTRPEARANRGDASSRARPEARRVFLSYSWDSDEYKLWVERLAVTLRDHGVDARIDRWRRQTQSIPEFMSSEVRNADRIVILCTPGLQRKVHATEDGEQVRGVGWESGLMTGALFAGAAPKIIAVLARGSWLEAAPSWLQGHAYVDLTDPATLEKGVLELIRQITGQTAEAPPLGRLPEELREATAEPFF